MTLSCLFLPRTRHSFRLSRRLQARLGKQQPVQSLEEELDQDYEALDETAEDGAAALVNELADAGPTPERICEQTERQEMLRKALAQISPKLRAAFQIREITGLSTRESADALGITKNTLKSRIYRARVAVGLHFEKVGGTQTLRTNRSQRPRIGKISL